MKKTTPKSNQNVIVKPPRKFTRFKPEPLTFASMSTKPDLTPHIGALVLNESFSGCSLLLTTSEKLKKDQKVHVKVGQLGAMSAVIVWIVQLDESIFKVGLQYLE
jgi:hypothetical protein